ncbi:MAG: hypothetical protein M1838_000919 [Thelocarpon superellum]|nr:MAG: hypothetical protein M1838_000919 [Thelocarpon superellum]
MASDELDVPRTESPRAVGEAGPYALRPLIESVQLGQDEGAGPSEVTCVELWEENLYVGTSSAEIMHFVLIPSDSPTESTPNAILATRLRPPHASSTLVLPQPGVQQILILPRVNKACVLCNNTLTFYSLPELSPAFGTTKVRNCTWVGGLDLDQGHGGPSPPDGEHIMIALRDRIQMNIDYPGSLLFARRGSIACVANTRAYALIDVDHQQKIPLFAISSLDEAAAGTVGGQIEDISPKPNSALARSTSTAVPASARGARMERGHERSTSLGTLAGSLGLRQQSPRGPARDAAPVDRSESLDRDESPTPIASSESPARRNLRTTSPDKPLPVPPAEGVSNSSRPSSLIVPNVVLHPHLISPRPNEFLLTTGTAYSEAGVGMFVNADGDVFRSTLEFEKYPESLALDGPADVADSSMELSQEDAKGYVLAVMERERDGRTSRGVEIQRWDVEPGAADDQKAWLDVATEPHNAPVGVRSVISPHDLTMHEVVERLRLVRWRPSGPVSAHDTPASVENSDPRTKASLERVREEMELFESHGSVESDPISEAEPALPSGWEKKRVAEEREYAQRLGRTVSRVVLWSGDAVWWVIRTPLAVRLDALLGPAVQISLPESFPLDRRKVMEVLSGIRGQDARTETEFITLGYLRQKASVLLFAGVLQSTIHGPAASSDDLRATEEALVEGGVDPRVILATLPALCDEVVEGRKGIWVHGGVALTAQALLTWRPTLERAGIARVLTQAFLGLLRGYLTAWRRKKGFGSIADEGEVFRTIDAALLRVLLLLDEDTGTDATESTGGTSIRPDLYALVDQGVDCFDRCVELLEADHRLYVLSRLYGSHKMPRKVLETWRRILEGEPDKGGSFVQGEQEVRRYLAKVRDRDIVEEYGAWLARRNAKLGVQVFADEKGRVRFEPAEVVPLLQQTAPAAVRDYLEYLVFTKQDSRYANDLIAHYLDLVLTVLEDSDVARRTLSRSYETYRALRPPRPTYRQFISENAIEEDWWRSRLRLLQLLGGSHKAASEYDVAAVLGRIEPFEQQLVPEMIILDGRQARHAQAIRLLTQGLGDFDTAINYCLFGVSSIYRPELSVSSGAVDLTRDEQVMLFGVLLAEFLQIENATDQIEQTANLLERFGGWYDVRQVLSMVPESWPVELIAPFLVSSFRRIVTERRESIVAKALSGAENLMLRARFIDECDKVGPAIEAAE